MSSAFESDSAHRLSSLDLVDHGLAEGRVMTQREYLEKMPAAMAEVLATRSQVLAPLSGHSGGGKTTLAGALAASDLPGESFIFDADLFLACRDVRHPLVLDPRTTWQEWWRRAYEWGQMTDVMGRLREMGEDGGELDFGSVYRKGEITKDPDYAVKQIPEGKKVVVAPGHELQLAALQAGYGHADMIRAVLLRDPRKALEAALIRDVYNGKGDAPDGLAFCLEYRAREYRLQEPVYREVTRQPDIAIIDNRHLEPDWNLIVNGQRVMLQSLLRAWDTPPLEVPM